MVWQRHCASGVCKMLYTYCHIAHPTHMQIYESVLNVAVQSAYSQREFSCVQGQVVIWAKKDERLEIPDGATIKDKV